MKQKNKAIASIIIATLVLSGIAVAIATNSGVQPQGLIGPMEILPGSITHSKLASNAVESDVIATNGITDSGDFKICPHISDIEGNFVVTGLAVSETSGGANDKAEVAAGTAFVEDYKVTLTAPTASTAFDPNTADSMYRYDALYINNDGTLGIAKGTENADDATALSLAGTAPATSAALALVKIDEPAAGPVVINTADITDQRFIPYDANKKVQTAKIKDEAVTNAKLAAQAIPSAFQLPANQADNAIGTTPVEVATATVTPDRASTLVITYSGRIIDTDSTLPAGEEIYAVVKVGGTAVPVGGDTSGKITFADTDSADLQNTITVYKAVTTGANTVTVEINTQTTDSAIGVEDQVLTVIAVPTA